MGKGRKGGNGGRRRRKKRCARADQGDEAAIEPSPLMRLPVELLLHILSFLPTADRLTARVNRTLYQLEEGARYYVSHMTVASKGHDFLTDTPLAIALDGPRSRYIEGLRKLERNVFFGSLSFFCDPENRVLIPYINALRAETLFLNVKLEANSDYEEVANEELNDENLDSWIGNRKSLSLYGSSPLSGERLHSLYSEMESGRSSLIRCLCDGPKQAESNKLLELIGITYADGRFHSSRKDVEVYVLRESADDEDDYEEIEDELTPNRYFFIVIGRMLVGIRKWTLMVAETLDSFEDNQLILEKHNVDGTLPQGREDLAFIFYSIAYIRNYPNQFKKLPVIYN